ncbi:PEP-CTERM sorting domain-containing protein [Thiohalophilus sp.]|uniref:PEP-CTERM sorting domain-containing protein n=1 Tax=Thiohalophilus sp. TaxID=3028392 RepID=UPI002ACDEE30|nr:PEP-CTERM sorting domain-containing protein [Thiohalophilus sp.]MDZ7805332.1 PEP-CTERM sorting domain-containing protein [Thiohalophilus sp.]
MKLRSISRNFPTAFTLILTCTLLPGFSLASIIGGVEFPQGEISFADSVVSYTPDASGGPVPSAANSEATNALGIPEVPGNTSIGACSGDPADCPFVSLGRGGSLVLEFVDNALTGSDNSDLDLWIFEVGPDVEDTYVDISTDGSDWFSVGKVFGTTSGVDIDNFGFGSSDLFSYIRLTDDYNEGGTSGASVGADIDAVGAISTVPVAVSEPASLLLIGLGFIGLGAATRSRKV